MLSAYRQQVEERAKLGIPALPLNAQQTSELCELLKNPPSGEEETLLDLLTNRVPPGVDAAAYVKAGFLTGVAKGEITCPLITPQSAVYLLGTMLGGYNVQSLVDLLKSHDNLIAGAAATALSHTLLVFDDRPRRHPWRPPPPPPLRRPLLRRRKQPRAQLWQRAKLLMQAGTTSRRRVSFGLRWLRSRPPLRNMVWP